MSIDTNVAAPHASTRNLAPFIVVGLTIAAWAYTGFMGPSALIAGTTVYDDCVEFAQDRNVFDGMNVRAINLRIRHSGFVVDLIANKEGDKNLKSRTCVSHGTTIKIVSMLEAGFWR